MIRINQHVKVTLSNNRWNDQYAILVISHELITNTLCGYRNSIWLP